MIEKETHRQEMEKQKETNKISEEKLIYLKDMERKLKAIMAEWRRSEDKQKVLPIIHALLNSQKDKLISGKQSKKQNEKFEEVGGEINVGDKVKMKQNRQTGVVKEIRGKKAILQVGMMPMTVDVSDLVVVVDKV